MDLFEYIESLPLHSYAINKLKTKIKQREAAIHTHAKTRVIIKAMTVTKYLSRVQREIYFKDELLKIRDEGIELAPVKKMKVSDV